MKMFLSRIASGLLVVGTVMICSNKIGVASVGDQQAAQDRPPIFDQENISILFRVNDKSSERPLDERCSSLNSTLRLIYNGTRPELVDASTLDVYKAAIEELENRSLEAENYEPVLATLKECAENGQRTQATSPTSTNNQHDLEQPPKLNPAIYSMLAQLEQTQEQLVRRDLTNNELLRQLESDLERERGLASHRDQVIAELQAKLSEAGDDPLGKSQTLDKLEQDLLEEQKRSLEKDILIEELKEKLRGAEQAYFALSDATSEIDSRGNESTVPSVGDNVQSDAGLSENQAQIERGPPSGATQVALDELTLEIEESKQTLARLSSGSNATSSGYIEGQPQPHDLDVNSILAQVLKTQEQLIGQHSSERERLGQLENDLARANSLALKREQTMGELQNKVREEEFKGILARLKFESDNFQKDLTRLLSEVDRANNLFAWPETRQSRRSDVIKLIIKRMNEFQRVLKRQLKTVLNIIDTLTAKWEQKSSRYEPTKRSLAKLESELQKFKQYPLSLSRSEEIRSMRQRLEEFHSKSEEQLKMIWGNVDSLEAELEQSDQQHELDSGNEENQNPF